MPAVVGYDETLKKRCTCKNCTAIVEYLAREVQSRSYRDYGGFSDTYHYIECPSCGKELQVSYPR